MKRYFQLLFAKISKVVLYGDTASMRLWLSMVEVLLSLYLWNAAHVTPYFDTMLTSLPVDNPTFWYCTAFFIHAIFLIAGLTGRYNVYTLMFEGVMGWCLWGIVAITNTMQQGFPGPFTACWLVMSWILIRYPTHWVRWGDRDD